MWYCPITPITPYDKHAQLSIKDVLFINVMVYCYLSHALYMTSCNYYIKNQKIVSNWNISAMYSKQLYAKSSFVVLAVIADQGTIITTFLKYFSLFMVFRFLLSYDNFMHYNLNHMPLLSILDLIHIVLLTKLQFNPFIFALIATHLHSI